MSSESAEEWFYEHKGEKIGPKSLDDMQWLAETDEIYPDTLVWKKGFDDWIKAEASMLGSSFFLDEPPPLSGSHINDTAIWLLAFAPLIGWFIQRAIQEMVYADSAYALAQAIAHDKFWWIALILNILLVVFDIRLLKKAGHNIKRIQFWLILIPVYMYRRAKMTKQNIAYVIVWCVCFAASMFL